MAFPSTSASFAWASKHLEALRSLAVLRKFSKESGCALSLPIGRCYAPNSKGNCFYRARALAVTGLFEGLHKDLSFSGNRLTVRRACRWDERMKEFGLLVVPSVFSWPDLFFRIRPAWQPAIVYPCRGSAELWDESVHPPAALEKRIGQSCARINSGTKDSWH